MPIPICRRRKNTKWIRINLPNRNYDPGNGIALYDRYIDEWLVAEDEGLEIMLNEHHQTATCVDPACADRVWVRSPGFRRRPAC